MIITDFQPYCSECERFKPIAESHTEYLSDGFTMRKDWVVHCVYQKECSAMVRFLKKEISKEKN